MESAIKIERKMIFTMTWEAIHGSNKKLLQKIPSNRATKNFITLQILQPVSIIWKPLRDLEGADPQGFKFSMLAFVLLGHIPFEY
jgi:hypothetical protein